MVVTEEEIREEIIEEKPISSIQYQVLNILECKDLLVIPENLLAIQRAYINSLEDYEVFDLVEKYYKEIKQIMTFTLKAFSRELGNDILENTPLETKLFKTAILLQTFQESKLAQLIFQNNQLIGYILSREYTPNFDCEIVLELDPHIEKSEELLQFLQIHWENILKPTLREKYEYVHCICFEPTGQNMLQKRFGFTGAYPLRKVKHQNIYKWLKHFTINLKKEDKE